MNILRELRRIKKKSFRSKILLLLIFSVMLISSIYAWSFMQARGKLDSVTGVVNAWDIEFYVEDQQILEEEVTFSAGKFYPGMENIYEVVNIHNLGTKPTKVSVEILSVKLFGEEIIDQLNEENEIKVNGTTLNLFTSKDKYPFDVSINYDELLKPKESDDNLEGTIGKVNFNVNWEYEAGNDDLDTEYGKKSYEYYQNEENILDALEVLVKITASAY